MTELSLTTFTSLKQAAENQTVSFRTETLTALDEIAELSPFIEDLCNRTGETNILLQPLVLKAAWSNLVDKKRHPHVLLYWAPSVPKKPDQLAALIPLADDHRNWCGFAAKTGFSSDMSFLGAPLIDPRFGAAIWTDFFKRQSKSSFFLPPALRLNLIEQQSSLPDVMDYAAGRAGWSSKRFSRHERAMFVCDPHDDDAVLEGLTRKKQKEVSRQKRRLCEKGALEFSVCSEPDEILDHLKEFALLEDRGWKGRTGTAILSNPSLAAYFGETIHGLSKKGKAEIATLRIDDTLLAAAIILIGSGKAWYYKMAYNEEYAVYSPGVHLTIELTRYLNGRSDIRQIDSCAVQNHPMINHIWRDRLAMTDILVVPMSGPGRHAYFLCEAGYRALRKGLKWGMARINSISI